MDAETWLNAHKAKELGFCDDVMYEDGADGEEGGIRPDFIFSSKAAERVLMNKVLASIPRPPVEPEHPPDKAERPADNVEPVHSQPQSRHPTPS